MCDRCADLDYAIAECWRPCYVPPRRGIQVNIHDSGESYFEPPLPYQRRYAFRTLPRPIRLDPRDSFEGIE